MTIAKFKTYALKTLCEAHLWEIGEEDFFSLLGVGYRIKREPDGQFTLTEKRPKDGMWFAPEVFPDLGRLFQSVFKNRCISYN